MSVPLLSSRKNLNVCLSKPSDLLYKAQSVQAHSADHAVLGDL